MIEGNYLKAPARANLYLTGACNLSCLHCYASKLGKKQDLTPTEWARVVQRLSDAGILEIVLLGGEPLFYAGLPTLLGVLNQSSLGVKISTNCTLVTPELARSISSVARAGVQVSLDGPNAVSNDSIRGKGAFALAMNGINLLKEHGVPITIGTVVNKRNLHSAIEMSNLAQSHGITGVHYMRIVPKGNAAVNWDDICLSNDDWVDFVRSVRTESAVGVLLQIDGTYEYRKDLEPMGQCMTGCEAGRYEITVLPDGSIVPCEMFDDDVIGSAVSDDILRLWNTHPSYKRFRLAKNQVEEPCRSCVVTYCSGCRYQAFVEHHDFYAPDPACVRDALINAQGQKE